MYSLNYQFLDQYESSDVLSQANTSIVSIALITAVMTTFTDASLALYLSP